MGTRADFWMGRGLKAEWLGSVGWDGHPENFGKILKAKTAAAFRAAVKKELAGRDDATQPTEGWPWPWNDSHLTDYSYAFDGGKVFHNTFARADERKPCPTPGCHGSEKVWVKRNVKMIEEENGDSYPVKHLGLCEFPDMSDRKSVKEPGSKGSGVMLLGGPR